MLMNTTESTPDANLLQHLESSVEVSDGSLPPLLASVSILLCSLAWLVSGGKFKHLQNLAGANISINVVFDPQTSLPGPFHFLITGIESLSILEC